MKRVSMIWIAFLGLSVQLSDAAPVEQMYQSYCASCHGADLNGAVGPALNDDIWKHGETEDAIAKVIQFGVAKAGMPAFNKMMDAAQIRAMVIFLRERGYANKSEKKTSTVNPDQLFDAQGYPFRLRKVAQVDDKLWAIELLPEGGFLATQTSGVLWKWDGGVKQAISGTPKVSFKGQGGLLDVRLAPDYVTSGWIYLTYSDPASNGSLTRVVRGKIKDGKWQDQETIFAAPGEFYSDTDYHFGSRLVFDGDYVFFSIGDRGHGPNAQDLSRPMGKVHRLHLNGDIPKDNPWVGQKNVMPSIWSYGHRNPQGITINPLTREIWAAEHGPRGGDEINLIEKAVNYGWPVITYGMNYDGTPMTDRTAAEGMQQPRHYWVPSIAISSIEFYMGEAFSKWKNNLIIGSLAKEELHLVTLDKNKVTGDFVLLKGLGRIRDLVIDKDGFPYLMMVNDGTVVYRMEPVVATKSELKEK